MSDDQATIPPGEKPKSAPVAAEGGDSGIAVLNEQIEIFHGRHLPQYDRGPVKAYVARRRGEAVREPFFALVCEMHLVPRISEASSYSGLNNPGLSRLVSCGPVFWAPANEARYVLVYENNLGQAIMSTPEQHDGMGWRHEHILKTIVRPMIGLLTDLRDLEIFHGNIRPSLMFDGGQKTFERVILGDCLALPPSYDQPVLYETIDRAMYDPIAKGRGVLSDDLYSFGVSLAVLLRRKNPLQGLSDREILREKIDQGSYAALMGKERVTGPLLEPLRGLLYDDKDQRWTLNEMMAWLDNQHVTSRQSTRKRRAARPLLFNEKPYDQQILLAMDLSSHPSQAVHLIENGSMEQWISHSLDDHRLKARFEEAVAAAGEPGTGPGYTERLLNRVSLALDPEGPIRFKGLSVHADGIPYAMAEAVVLKKDVQIYAEIINQYASMSALMARDDLNDDVSPNFLRYDTARVFLRQANIGYGIERCLYFLNPDVPCLSDAIRKYYARSAEDVLYAFEALSRQSNHPTLFIDRHIAAFLSVRDKRAIDVFTADLNAPEMTRKILGNIKVLAAIQRHAKLEAFPGISAWIAEIVEPVYDRFHDRELRAKLRKKMEKLKGSGDLYQIAALLDDYEVLQGDFSSFRAAMEEYQRLVKEQGKLEADLEDPDAYTRDTSREAAAIVSGLLSGILILGLCFLHFLNKGIF